MFISTAETLYYSGFRSVFAEVQAGQGFERNIQLFAILQNK